MSARPYVIPCHAFGGFSKKSGKAVGSRHRWPLGWGLGRCEFCGRSIDQVMRRKGDR